MQRVLIPVLLIIVVAAIALWFLWPRETAPELNYVGNSPEECSRIQVLCIPGFERFDDEKGCGCRPVSE